MGTFTPAFGLNKARGGFQGLNLMDPLKPPFQTHSNVK